METLGQFLKREREFRGISLDDLSRKTRINFRFLQYMEQDYWEGLPKGAFLKGFLKSYATELGVPLDEVFRRYEAQKPQEVQPSELFRKFRGFEVRNQFFLFLLFAVLVIVLAAYLSSR